MVSGAAEPIGLFGPFRILCCDSLACLGQLVRLGDSWPGCYARQSVFGPARLGFLLDLLYLVHHCAFRYYGYLGHFMLAWINLH